MARRMTSPVLVGRADVVRRLEAALGAAQGCEPHHLVIGGEAGIGKTRLLEAARELAEERGFRVLLGRCVAMGDAGLPFAPYTDILRALVAYDGAPTITALAGRASADLSRLVPSLSPEEPAAIEERWAQLRLQEALVDLLRRLAGRSPLLVALEDLHWADEGTLSATSYLLRAVRGWPIAIMATFRSETLRRDQPLRPWLAEVVRDPSVERIDVPPFGEAETAALVHHIRGQDLPSPELTEIWQRTDGNPFFIEEILAARDGGSGAALTASLRDVLLSRVDALSEGARHLVSVAAVGGREVEHEALMAVAGGDASQVPVDLTQLVDAGLLVPTRALDGDDAYTFRHALLQEAVYDTTLPSERRRLHRRWAEELEGHVRASAEAGRLVDLAHHWREAHDPRALQASVRAGDAAMAGYSYAIASDQYEEALAIWEETIDGGAAIDRIDLLERAARAAHLAARHRRALALCREAIRELAERDAGRLTGLQLLLARTLWVSGDYAASTDAYETAVRTAPPDLPLIRARAVAGLGQVYMLHGRLSDARPLCEEAIATARAAGARDIEGHALNTLSVLLAGLGETRAAGDAIDRALAIALELGIPDDIGRAYVNRAEVESAAGYSERAVATSIEGLQAAAEWGVSSSYGAFIAFGAVSFAFDSGRWDQAAAMLAEADRIVGDAEGSAVYRASYLLELLACTGDAGFEVLWERTRRMVAGTPPSDNQVAILQGGLWRAAFSGRHEEACRLMDESLALIASMDAALRLAELARLAAWPVADMGREARREGDHLRLAEARRRLTLLAVAVTTTRALLPDPGERLTRLLELDALQVEAERGRMDGDDSSERWACLARGWTEVGRPFRAAVARWREAEAAEADGHRDAAREALLAAHQAASRLGARPLLDLLETTARRLRVRLVPAAHGLLDAGAPGQGLTPREREVLLAVAAGRTNRQIAEALFISESTAGVHVSNILGKLGASTRTEAARIAIEQGMIG